MAWKLALVWSETTEVLKKGSCWAVTHQTKKNGGPCERGASPNGLRDSDEGHPRVCRGVVPKVAKIQLLLLFFNRPQRPVVTLPCFAVRQPALFCYDPSL
jgi:hypothetical protein